MAGTANGSPLPLLDLGGASRRTAGLSPSEARGKGACDLDSPAAGATIIPVQGGVVPSDPFRVQHTGGGLSVFSCEASRAVVELDACGMIVGWVPAASCRG